MPRTPREVMTPGEGIAGSDDLFGRLGRVPDLPTSSVARSASSPSTAKSREVVKSSSLPSITSTSGAMRLFTSWAFGWPPIGDPDGAAHPEATLGEVQPVAVLPAAERKEGQPGLKVSCSGGSSQREPPRGCMPGRSWTCVRSAHRRLRRSQRR